MISNTTRALAFGCSAIAIATAAPVSAATFGSGCGGSPIGSATGAPSLSATEISTSQAIELIRQRRTELADQCPAGTVSVGGTCQPQPTLVAATSQAPQPQPVAAAAPPPAPAAAAQSQTPPAVTAQSQAKQGVAQPKAKAAPANVAAQPAPAKAKPQTPPSAPPKYSAPQPAESFAPVGDGRTRVAGTWAEVFLDFERHKNMNGGDGINPTRHQRTAGMLAGADWGARSAGSRPEGALFGLLGGYTHLANTFTNNSFTTDIFANGANLAFRVLEGTGIEQTLSGGSVGLYGVYFLGGFSTDLTYKADFFDFQARGQLSERLFENSCGGFLPAPLPGGATTLLTSLDGSTNVTNHTIAANANYKFGIGGGWWLEPTAGMRFTYGDFDSDAAALGLADGHAVRVQGGMRVGTGGINRDGSFWTMALTGLLYSDVAISGFVAKTAPVLGLPPTIADVDEGKLRALGMIQSKITLPSGYTYYGQVELRGGEDVIGGGGKVGIRYEW